MSDLNTIVSVSVSRTSAVVSVAGFGTPAVVAQFLTTKTTAPFSRSRYYASLAAMISDGWVVGDCVYDAAAQMFSQSPAPSKILVGRLDSSDATVSAGLAAIQQENSDWYSFSLVGRYSCLVTLSGALVTGNVINSTVHGITVGSVTFTTDHATTMNAWKTNIQTALNTAGYPTSTVNVAGNTISITQIGRDIVPVVATVTAGASQATATYSYTNDQTGILSAAAWTETQMKIMGVSDADVQVITAGETTNNIASKLKALNYTRTYVMYHALPAEYIECAWMANELATTVGASSWAYDTLKGVTVDGLSNVAESTVYGKNANAYTLTAGVNVTRNGQCEDGGFVDIIRGIDWIKTNIQAGIFTQLIATGKIPYNDIGGVIVQSAILGVLKTAESMGILQTGSSTCIVPKFSTIGTTDRATRNFPSVTFSGVLQGAIQTVAISGTLTI